MTSTWHTRFLSTMKTLPNGGLYTMARRSNIHLRDRWAAGRWHRRRWTCLRSSTSCGSILNALLLFLSLISLFGEFMLGRMLADTTFLLIWHSFTPFHMSTLSDTKSLYMSSVLFLLFHGFICNIFGTFSNFMCFIQLKRGEFSFFQRLLSLMWLSIHPWIEAQVSGIGC